MINLNATVLNWYIGTRAGVVPAIFRKAQHRQKTPSIHHILNLNDLDYSAYRHQDITNALAVIYLRRKRGLSTLDNLTGIAKAGNHQLAGNRLLRRFIKASSRIKPGDLVWAFDYPTEPPYHIGNACKLEYVEKVKGEHKLKRPDNGEIVYFRFVSF